MLFIYLYLSQVIYPIIREVRYWNREKHLLLHSEAKVNGTYKTGKEEVTIQ